MAGFDFGSKPQSSQVSECRHSGGRISNSSVICDLHLRSLCQSLSGADVLSSGVTWPQRNEAERAELPGQIEELQAEAGRLGGELQAAEAAAEALDGDCRGEREDITRQQQARSAGDCCGTTGRWRLILVCTLI